MGRRADLAILVRHDGVQSQITQSLFEGASTPHLATPAREFLPSIFESYDSPNLKEAARKA
jgi:hypothetical protein